MGIYLAVNDMGWILIAVAGLMLIGVIVGFYTRTGSGIETHPRGRRRGTMAPGAEGPGETSGRDEGESPPMQHGTR